MQTYLFYDLETTGLNPVFDQIIRFAAIRTDLSLNEIERYELEIKLNPDCIPSPGALLTHQISIAESLRGISEHEAIIQIHQWMNTPETISIGYNTIDFDDQFLRFTFYRNLLNPYSHQFEKGCSRIDLYSIAVLYYLFDRDVMKWPVVQDKVKLKLELINQENQFATGRAHTAMVDVEITLNMARQFIKSQAMWKKAISYFDKESDQEHFRKLPATLESSYGLHQCGLMFDGALGATQNFLAPVVCLGQHQYHNKMIWLRLDKLTLRDTKLETIAKNTWVKEKRWGEPEFILPPKAYATKLLPSRYLTLAQENQAWLSENLEIFNGIISFYRKRSPADFPNKDVEAKLYGSEFDFYRNKVPCKQFHLAKPIDKVKWVEKMRDPILKELGLRILGRNFTGLLMQEQSLAFAKFVEGVGSEQKEEALVDFKGRSRLEPRAVLVEIAGLRNTVLSDVQKGLLDGLEGYLEKWVPRREFCREFKF